MSARILLTAFISAAAIAGLSACHTPTAPSVTTTVTAPPAPTTAASAASSSAASLAPSSATAPTGAAPTTAALTRRPCDLLTPEVAKKYVGEDAQRQLAYDAHPPVPVGDDACYYAGATREIEVSIFGGRATPPPPSTISM
jgi:hypothetical protein